MGKSSSRWSPWCALPQCLRACCKGAEGGVNTGSYRQAIVQNDEGVDVDAVYHDDIMADVWRSDRDPFGQEVITKQS